MADFEEAFDMLFELSMQFLRIISIGKITKYDFDKNVVDIECVFKKEITQRSLIYQILYFNVSLLMNHTENNGIYLPVEKDNYVILLSCSRSIKEFILD